MTFLYNSCFAQSFEVVQLPIKPSNVQERVIKTFVPIWAFLCFGFLLVDVWFQKIQYTVRDHWDHPTKMEHHFRIKPGQPIEMALSTD